MPDIYPGTDIAKPPPAHTLTTSAHEAREALLAYARANPLQLDDRDHRARRKPLERAEPDLVSVHAKPWQRIEVAELAGGAKSFALAAEAAGRVVAARRAGSAVQVGVRHRERSAVEMRATWVEGRTTGVIADGRKVTLATAKGML